MISPPPPAPPLEGEGNRSPLAGNESRQKRRSRQWPPGGAAVPPPRPARPVPRERPRPPAAGPPGPGPRLPACLSPSPPPVWRPPPPPPPPRRTQEAAGDPHSRAPGSGSLPGSARQRVPGRPGPPRQSASSPQAGLPAGRCASLTHSLRQVLLTPLGKETSPFAQTS